MADVLSVLGNGQYIKLAGPRGKRYFSVVGDHLSRRAHKTATGALEYRRMLIERHRRMRNAEIEASVLAEAD